MASFSTMQSDGQTAGASTALAQTADEDLARAGRRGSSMDVAEAFGELYRRYFNKVYAYHLLRTGSVADAQDLTSQTFMAALESLPRFAGRGTFAAWLMGIAHNKMAMHFRQKRPVLDLDTAEAVAYTAPRPEEQTDRRVLLRQVGQALRALNPERAEAFLLRTFGGLSAAEIALVMGKSEGAVKMLVLRALREIREKLGAEWVMEE